MSFQKEMKTQGPLEQRHPPTLCLGEYRSYGAMGDGEGGEHHATGAGWLLRAQGTVVSSWVLSGLPAAPCWLRHG